MKMDAPVHIGATCRARNPGFRAPRRARAMGHGHRAPYPSRPSRLVRRLGRGISRSVCRAGARRHADPAESRQAPWQLPGALGSRRRGARRGPHFHLQHQASRRRTDQQLGGTGADEGAAAAACSTGACEGAPCTWCPSAWGRSVRPLAKIGVQITDSAYVAVSMRDHDAHGARGAGRAGRRTAASCPACIPSACRCAPGQADVPWPCNPEHKYIVHFPGGACRSGRSAAATAATRCSARSASRCASPPAWDASEGWLAEHMLILGVESPAGEKTYVAAAFPSACGKTNFAMLIPPPCVRGLEDHHHRRRHRLDQARRRRTAVCDQSRNTASSASRPAPRGSPTPTPWRCWSATASSPTWRMTPDGDVWWEGMTDEPPAQLIDWQGNPWTPASGTKAAHPNARFTVAASQCPSIDPDWENPQGVPISAFIFGGRRTDTVPLVYETFSWSDGVYAAATMGSETTAAATGKVGEVRRDPFAMLPFCGYHMGDYFDHWLNMGRKLAAPAAHLLRQLVPQGRRGQVPVAGLRREHARAASGSWIAARAARVRRESVLGWMPRGAGPGMVGTGRRGAGALRGSHGGGARRLDRGSCCCTTSCSRNCVTSCPEELVLRRELLLASLARSPERWTVPRIVRKRFTR